jgi:hypothetical protein
MWYHNQGDRYSDSIKTAGMWQGCTWPLPWKACPLCTPGNLLFPSPLWFHPQLTTSWIMYAFTKSYATHFQDRQNWVPLLLSQHWATVLEIHLRTLLLAKCKGVFKSLSFRVRSAWALFTKISTGKAKRRLLRLDANHTHAEAATKK